jgi:tRNA-specific 2-thiouridylase
MERILTAMSGGVDSAAACGFLREAGFAVGGATMLLRDGGEAEVRDAECAARQMGLEFHVFEWKEEFRENVIEPFLRTYAAGQTPNPCVFCNRTMKFGLFLERALSLGYDAIATGHYARVEQDEKTGRYLLKTAREQARDQTYVLWSLTQAQLSRIRFPLGDRTKAQAREMAAQLGLSVASKHDSQDICFVPDGDYMAYCLRSGLVPHPGRFLGPDGAPLGTHAGQEAFTIGQRRGLGRGFGQKTYVIGKNGGDVVLGSNADLFSSCVNVRLVNYIPFDAPDGPLRVDAKLRYTTHLAPALLTPTPQGCVLQFDAPQRAVTPGQSAVFYQGETVVGGGIIDGAVENCGRNFLSAT